MIILYVRLLLTHFFVTHSETCFIAAPLVISSPSPLLRKAPPIIRLLKPEVVKAKLKVHITRKISHSKNTLI